MRGKHLEEKKKRRRGKFSKVAVWFILIQVFSYAWVHLYFSYKVGMEIAPVFSCALLAFCGAEAGLLAWIKKIKEEKNNGTDS